jgi:small subunit ribosomal protein S20
MPNIKSSKKRAEQSEKRRLVNYSRKSDVKTAVKKVLDAVAANDVDGARTLLRQAQAKLARAQGKGLLHRNATARKMSRLAKKVASIASPAAK